MFDFNWKQITLLVILSPYLFLRHQFGKLKSCALVARVRTLSHTYLN